MLEEAVEISADRCVGTTSVSSPASPTLVEPGAAASVVVGSPPVEDVVADGGRWSGSCPTVPLKCHRLVEIPTGAEAAGRRRTRTVGLVVADHRRIDFAEPMSSPPPPVGQLTHRAGQRVAFASRLNSSSPRLPLSSAIHCVSVQSPTPVAWALALQVERDRDAGRRRIAARTHRFVDLDRVAAAAAVNRPWCRIRP